MGGFMAQALSSLFKENEELVTNARILGGVAACRIHRREASTNLASGERTFRWEIEFKTEEDASTFDGALRNIVEAVTEGGRE
jgi:hypothetical protein